MIKDLVNRFASKKFVTAVGAYVLILLDGAGVIEISNEVQQIATAALLAEIVAQGVVDSRG